MSVKRPLDCPHCHLRFSIEDDDTATKHLEARNLGLLDELHRCREKVKMLLRSRNVTPKADSPYSIRLIRTQNGLSTWVYPFEIASRDEAKQFAQCLDQVRDFIKHHHNI